jgi:hypothetical protein
MSTIRQQIRDRKYRHGFFQPAFPGEEEDQLRAPGDRVVGGRRADEATTIKQQPLAVRGEWRRIPGSNCLIRAIYEATGF